MTSEISRWFWNTSGQKYVQWIVVVLGLAQGFYAWGQRGVTVGLGIFIYLSAKYPVDFNLEADVWMELNVVWGLSWVQLNNFLR